MDIFYRRIRQLVVGFIRLYQWIISPVLGQHCRFYPNCSTYAIQAINEYGIFYGTWLIVRRLLRCHPWHPGGIDNLPPKSS